MAGAPAAVREAGARLSLLVGTHNHKPLPLPVVTGCSLMGAWRPVHQCLGQLPPSVKPGARAQDDGQACVSRCAGCSPGCSCTCVQIAPDRLLSPGLTGQEATIVERGQDLAAL